jgi:hypothetical protein
MNPIDSFLLRLLDAARKIFEVLWPDVMPPKRVSELTTWLAQAPGRVDEWRASAARAGAEMALLFVLSWYDEIQLSQLEARRASVVLPIEELRASAIAIVAYADVEDFIVDPNEPAVSEAGDIEGDDATEDEGGDLAEGADGGPGNGPDGN